MKITVTYIIEFNGQKITRTASAEAENGTKVSDELADSLWMTARKSLPQEKKEPEAQ